MRTSLNVQHSVVGQSEGAPTHFCEFYLQELDPALTVNNWQKCPHASGRGREKMNPFEIHQRLLVFCFFYQELPSRETS